MKVESRAYAAISASEEKVQGSTLRMGAYRVRGVVKSATLGRNPGLWLALAFEGEIAATIHSRPEHLLERAAGKFTFSRKEESSHSVATPKKPALRSSTSKRKEGIGTMVPPSID